MAFVNVEGTVERTFFDGRGAEVVERFTVKGREITKRWTCWFDAEHGLIVGDSVKVSGLHGDELNTWEKDGETKHSVKRSINKARVDGNTSQTPPAPAGDVWGAPEGGGFDDGSVPF